MAKGEEVSWEMAVQGAGLSQGHMSGSAAEAGHSAGLLAP